LEERKMKKLLAVLVLVCVAVGSAQAADVFQWFGSLLSDGTGQTTEWTNGDAWLSEATGTHGVAPGTEDRAKVNGVWGNPGPVISSAVSVGEIFISEGPADLAPQSLTIGAGGNLVTGGGLYPGQVNIGYASWNVGTLIMDGGTATITEHLWLGWSGKGILQMNSGTLNTMAMFAPGWNGGTAEIHLDGGVLNSAQWWGGVDADHLAWNNYTFDITGGTWSLAGFWLDQMAQLIDNGQITGYGNSDNVVVTWDEVNERTIVTAIPEPISIALLGLGALLLRRRS
jgi:hypothetical protein